VSIRPRGATELGTKAEIKNMNSFKAVQRAIQSEIDRQIDLVKKGERVVQETRLWNEATQSTFSMRSKEDAHDYRYFPEPDLVPLAISKEWVEKTLASMPELPEARRQRYVKECGLSEESAGILVENKDIADFYDHSLKLGADAKAAANLLLNTAIGQLTEAKTDLALTRLSPENLKDIVESVGSGILNSSTGKQVLLDILSMSREEPAVKVSEYISQKGLAQISNEGELEGIVKKVLDNSPKQVADYKAGKTKIRGYFFGEVMKATSGKANTELVNKLLDKQLS
jgi:aspartyl-tRNA(Asn)/glutamyl-tRNA(Gln) amidotransferase subunit B